MMGEQSIKVGNWSICPSNRNTLVADSGTWTPPSLRYQPVILSDDDAPVHSNWDKILNHIGAGPERGLREPRGHRRASRPASISLGLGRHMIRHPFSPLPYLFLFGPENTGKSIFHGSIDPVDDERLCTADRS